MSIQKIIDIDDFKIYKQEVCEKFCELTSANIEDIYLDYTFCVYSDFRDKNFKNLLIKLDKSIPYEVWSREKNGRNSSTQNNRTFYLSVPKGKTYHVGIFYHINGMGGTSALIVINKKHRLDFCRWYKAKTKVVPKSEIIKPILHGDMLQDIHNEVFDIFEYLKEAKEAGVKLNKGLIFQGSPGNGKTMCCKYLKKVADEKGLSHHIINGANIEQSFSKNELIELMHCANLLIFDDVDIAYFDRRSHKSSVACGLLSAMDSPAVYKNMQAVVKIFTTNEDIENMDEAFLRPGRIEKMYKFPVPDEGMREKFIRAWHKTILDKIPDSDIMWLAKNTKGFSFAWMEEIKSKIFNRMIKNQKLDFQEIVNDISLSTVKKNEKSVGFKK